jgi:glutaminase
VSRQTPEGDDPSPFVSTGQLPAGTRIATLLHEAWQLFRDDTGGQVSQVYPALGRVPRDLFGICVAGTDGSVHVAGDAASDFTIMSVSKPFVFALVCEALGPDRARALLGANSTGMAFDALAAIEVSPDGRTNPMVNPGALMTTGLVPGASADDRWQLIQASLSAFAGRPLSVHAEVYRSASETNFRNRSIAALLKSLRRLDGDLDETVDLYTRQCALVVTARDLAIMGATLASGGVNPVTRERVVAPAVCHYTLAVMATAGMYETSGDWLYDVGVPAKSGIGGGIVTVAPGKGAMGTFAPPLDDAGNSVKGQLVARYLSTRLGLDLFASRPSDGPPGPRP